MSLTRPLCTDQLMGAEHVDLLAFTKAILTIIANSPGLLGHSLQLSHKVVFYREGHLDIEEALLCLEAINVRFEYRVLIATDKLDTMWVCIIFVTPGFSVQEVTDEQLFS
ncbi:hypothetical protein NDU88_003155 [Pleurodeles waltl]|uniref:Uncharacterized protein n=1 Tax=Pleurodeles waltl TaxID=8319 RepID=A0AAV7M4J7_PLEWA|nr:hypothetical protein NDU88_003155 [Pleurodeles waltl]